MSPPCRWPLPHWRNRARTTSGISSRKAVRMRGTEAERSTVAEFSLALVPRRLSDGAGHRSRLRQRLFEGGPEALHPHELVEYLLALAFPRRDTKKLAKRMIDDFGGFAQLLSADAGTIMRRCQVSENVAAAIKIAQASAIRLLKAEATGKQVLG